MEEAFRALLLANAGIAAVVERRITWAVRPQGSPLPAIVLWLVSQSEGHTHDGPEGAIDAVIQADCWGRTYEAAKATARALNAAVNGFCNAPAGMFQGIFVLGQRDTFDDEQPQPFFRTSLDIRVWHTAA